MGKIDLLREIKITKNKELYYNCPSEYLRDFDFIIEIINIFKDDFDFIDEVAESYVKYIPAEDINENPEYVELCILLGQYVPKGHPYYIFYTNRLEGIYGIYLLNIILLKKESSDISELGFSVLMDVHEDRKNILDYFARRLMDELYHKNRCGNFEDLVHKYCDNAKNIVNEGYVDFFIRNLYGVDESLSYYVFDHTYLLDSLVDELDAVCENWDDYEETLSEKCVFVVKEWVNNKKENNKYGNDFDYEQAMNEVILSMNFCNMFNLNKRDILNNRNKVLSFSAMEFKKDLKEFINKVLIERMTLTELDSLELDDIVESKKVLKK